MRRTAFTLMELLIVVSIIMVLMGMLFVGLRLGKEQANKAKTSAAMATLQAELANYKQINGKFPETGTDSSGAVVDLLPTKEFFAISDAEWMAANSMLMTKLKAAGAAVPDLMKDGWGRPLHYRPAKSLPYLTTAGAVLIDSDDPPGRDSYQLWSTGPDGAQVGVPADQGGVKGSDDMTTWEKK